MKAFFRRLNRTSRVLLVLFVVLAGLALHNYFRYAPGSRHRLRTFYDDAYGFPVYVNQLDFYPDEQPATGSANAVVVGVGPVGIDSSEVRANTPTGEWGRGPVSIDTELLPLPTVLAVNYTSVAEQRSYGGRVPLPRTRFDSVLAHLNAHPALYQSMYAYPDNQPGFELQAGLGPGGLVIVWLLGEQYQVELARAHLPVVPTTWPKAAGVNPDAAFTEPGPPARRFAELRRQVGRAELARLDSFPHVSPALPDSLGRRYRYRLRVLGQPLAPATLDASFLNNEQEPLPTPGGEAGVLFRAVPDALQYTVAGTDLPTHERSTVFEPRETRRAFARVQAACAPGEVPELRLTTSGEDVRVELRCHHLTVPLLRAITYVGPD
ncbi:DUF2931 family protein [Hymenobacter negativus]|uniref:DUF2931 family protein n=1 Tax=Hymenobacter negativus TaxID=2795026 RepID=A0ABS3QNC3_9BACT|nr:DUF2931 family protein [Hymenobacter negativus]MBO2012190.1 DUF2931 family protein [Hymenobacter negativus]